MTGGFVVLGGGGEEAWPTRPSNSVGSSLPSTQAQLSERLRMDVESHGAHLFQAPHDQAVATQMQGHASWPPIPVHFEAPKVKVNDLEGVWLIPFLEKAD